MKLGTRRYKLHDNDSLHIFMRQSIQEWTE